jgi:hypothetical protein
MSHRLTEKYIPSRKEWKDAILSSCPIKIKKTTFFDKTINGKRKNLFLTTFTKIELIYGISNTGWLENMFSSNFPPELHVRSNQNANEYISIEKLKFPKANTKLM